MIIDCKLDPFHLIGRIGDPHFMICDDQIDAIYRHPDHPRKIRIIDCEDGVSIDVHAESDEETLIMAEALCDLLNQDYYRPGVRERGH